MYYSVVAGLGGSILSPILSRALELLQPDSVEDD
jgi:hypothetical protein